MNLRAPGMILLPPEDRTLPRMLEIQAISHGDGTLLTCANDSWTFRDARDIAGAEVGEKDHEIGLPRELRDEATRLIGRVAADDDLS